ncbi:photosystem reaction center subunit H [Cypionkella aquatica]|uniref:Photosystem reaction center subunit H n=1 Tax=Cypionkella aquatica TaxID=1756042 RepID=A0AA37U5I6_9RHOB|nr:PRC-barrel domain-containing protein [Cypionkella aquatica]GLS88771.1 photosystem reaction center subunit H [Cypionkella aquatica]
MKKFLLSTAMVAGLSGAAFAQDSASAFRAAADPLNVRASDFIGMRIYASEAAIDATEYNGTQDGWDDIGEVNDVILSRDGKVDAVLVDIGGFLGMGERQVAVGMEAIKFVSDSATADAPDDFFLVMSAKRADFEAAPAYTMGDATTAPAATAEAPAADAMAADTTMADTTTADTTRAPLVREGYVAADATVLTSEKLTGAKVYDATDASIGEVSNLVLSADGKIEQVIVDVGGFLGMGEKPVALPLAEVDILKAADGDELRVYLGQTKEQLEALPKYEG